MSVIRAARADELAHLSALCLRSKAVWGYDPAFLDACRAELTMTVEALEASTVLVVAEPGQPAAALAQFTIDGEVLELKRLYVEPAAMRQGLGARLFADIAQRGRDAGAARMRIEADPSAAPFYERMGARRIGSAPSGSIAGRSLPLLELDLRAAHAKEPA